VQLINNVNVKKENKMTIAQALKLKNKTTAKLSKLWQRFHESNSYEVGHDPTYFASDLWEEINQVTSELILLKAKIHEASAPVRADIFHMSELKTTVQRLRGLSTNKGTVTRFDTVTTYSCVYDGLWKDTQLETIENKIEELQEKLDTFNHTVTI
jgi:hypothetical protein